MRRVASIVGTILGLVLLFLRYANKISNELQFISLPDELKQALIAMSKIPTLLAWLGFGVGLCCLGYLLVDSHGKKISALVSRRPRVIFAMTALVICLAGSVASAFWLMKTLSATELPIPKSESITENKPTSPAEQIKPSEKTSSEQRPTSPKEENLVGSATLLFNADDNTLAVLKYEGIRSVAVEPISNGMVVPQSFRVTFVFYPYQGPFDVKIDVSGNNFGTLGPMSGLSYYVSDNGDRFVSVAATRGMTIATTHEAWFKFYKKER